MSGLDLVIRGGTVIDGTGADGYLADVGIAGGRIAEIGQIAANGARVIDAEGHVVTPGFIDGHTHMDAQMHWDHLGANSCWHGVTSVVMGNCGFSIAPMRKGQQALVARSLERAEDISGAAMAAGIDFCWESYADYLDVVDKLPKGINHAAYVGHSALRTFAMGERAFSEAASADDMALMQAELARGLDAGAMGFSTSRSAAHLTSDDKPVASRLASRDEVAALVGSMKGRKGAVFELAHEILLPGNLDGDAYWQWLKQLAVSSGAHVSQIADRSIQTHLLAYFVRETGLLSLPEAIHMMTGRSAQHFGFAGRGELKLGNIADINVIDPATVGPQMPEVVHDLPTGARRFSQRATGIAATLVAGEVLIDRGEHTGALPGKLLRRKD